MVETRSTLHTVATWAMAIDGKIACAHGAKPRLAGKADLTLLRALRRQSDALIVGASTVRAIDPPMHLADAPPEEQPLVVVLSSAGAVPSEARALQPLAGARPPWLVTARPGLLGCPQLQARVDRGALRHLACPGGEAGRGPLQAPLDVRSGDSGAGRADADAANLALAKADAAGSPAAGTCAAGPEAASAVAIDIAALAGHLQAAGCRRLLVEGGGETVWGFANAGLIDELFVTVAPMLLGGQAPTPMGGSGFGWAQRQLFALQSAQARGDEVALHYVRRRPTRGA